MAKTDNLGDFLKDIAAAIRAVRKEPDSISIPAQDFSAKIREMTYNSGPVTPEIERYDRVPCTVTNSTDAWVQIDTSSSNITVDSISSSGDITCQARKDSWISITYNENAGKYSGNYDVSTDGVSGPDNMVYDSDHPYDTSFIISEEYYVTGDPVIINITDANNSSGGESGGGGSGGDSGDNGTTEPSGTYYTFNIVSNPNNISIGYINKTGSTSTTGTVSNDFVLADSFVYIGDNTDMSAANYDISFEGLDELSDEYQDGVYTNYRYEVIGDVTITGY